MLMWEGVYVSILKFLFNEDVNWAVRDCSVDRITVLTSIMWWLFDDYFPQWWLFDKGTNSKLNYSNRSQI